MDSAAPEITATHLVSHTEEIVIARPPEVVVRAVQALSLEDTIDRSSKLPSVSGTHPLTEGEFGPPGSRRLACLTDGSALVEQILERTLTPSDYRFRYVVWNYTTAQARAIDYGVGDFLYAATQDGGTTITWTYSFQLKRGEFPGYLGPLGRLLFRATFLDREYADMMRGTLQVMERATMSTP